MSKQHKIELLINNRTYTLSCAPGEEQRLRQLGAYIEGRLNTISSGSGAANDHTLLMMLSLIMADELAEANSKLRQGGSDEANTSTVTTGGDLDRDELAARIEKISSRVTAIAEKLVA